MNKLKLFIFTVILALVQILTNSLSIFYFDILGIFLIILIINEDYSLYTLTILATTADLIGHWYLGSHLFASLILTILSSYLINYYKMSNHSQKNLLLSIFFILYQLVIYLIDVFTRNPNRKLINYAIEMLLIAPILLKLYYTFSKDILFNE